MTNDLCKNIFNADIFWNFFINCVLRFWNKKALLKVCLGFFYKHFIINIIISDVHLYRHNYSNDFIFTIY